MQIASYLPIVNIAFADNAAEFSGNVAAIVTFDIPGVDMEFVFRGLADCPEEDTILTDWRQEPISDETKLNEKTWAQVRPIFQSTDNV